MDMDKELALAVERYVHSCALLGMPKVQAMQVVNALFQSKLRCSEEEALTEMARTNESEAQVYRGESI